MSITVTRDHTPRQSRGAATAQLPGGEHRPHRLKPTGERQKRGLTSCPRAGPSSALASLGGLALGRAGGARAATAPVSSQRPGLAALPARRGGGLAQGLPYCSRLSSPSPRSGGGRGLLGTPASGTRRAEPSPGRGGRDYSSRRAARRGPLT